MVALHHLFGSDEATALAAPIQQRVPEPYVALAEAEASRLNVNDGSLLSVTLGSQQLQLPVRVSAELPLGVVGLPVGLPGIPPLHAYNIVSGLQEVTQ